MIKRPIRMGAMAVFAAATVFAPIAAVTPAQAQYGTRPVPPEDLLTPREFIAPPQNDTQRQRINDLEESLRQLTGRLEELSHQIDLLSQKNDRMQKQLDFMANNPIASEPSIAPPPPADNALASARQDRPAPPVLAPATGSLGTLPAGTRLPEPSVVNDDPSAEFDAAMGLLARAQYDRARQSFRSFAETHPNTDLGAQALYWTGDIAYSAKKDYEAAARDFAELLKKYPKAQRAPEGMLKLGLSLIALGQKKEGCVALAALPKTYPNAANVATRAKTEAKSAACS